MSEMTFEELVEIKRDGHAHTAEQLQRIIGGYVSGEMPDYQMAAWLMAVFLRGMSADETVEMTRAMVDSGVQIDLSSIPGVKVDKHSTGGVADTATLVIAPLVAACGVPVAKMSGRGLGHTGGTLDKLESIPGFAIELSAERFEAQVREVGIAVIAQSPDVDPADKMIYALRDVTATVPSVPLIVGSIISKKVAGGADAILIDVKVGSGAFMKSLSEARVLASELVRVGEALGRRVACELTDMDQPLGMAVGNALEVAEAIGVLAGTSASSALEDVSIASSARLLVMAGAAPDLGQARDRVERALRDGSALAKMREWIEAQGGDPLAVDDPLRLPQARFIHEVRSRDAGFVRSFDTEGVGRCAMLLGAGRARKEDSVDPAAGVVLAVRVGDRVESGGLLATLHADDESLFREAAERFLRSVVIGIDAPMPPPLFLDDGA